ncbi:MAG: exosortase C-terminal domain/associated protein EpsI [Candidatus Acidiferrales bacterium]
MRSRSMTIRLVIAVAVLLGGTVLLHAMSHGEPFVARTPLKDLSYQIGNWTGTETPLDSRMVEAAGVTDYTSRRYSGQDAPEVDLYIGYYASQRTGDTIHSPKNCLPGSGWDPIHQGYAIVPLADGQKIKVNEYIVAQGLEKDLVFYWYQGRGRVVASEYWGKFWMIDDAITRNRTDGALVRLITPIAGDRVAEAHARLEKFAETLYPSLSKFIPN